MMRSGFAGVALLMVAACTPAEIETPVAIDTELTLSATQSCALAETATGAMIAQIDLCQIDLGAGEPRVFVSSDPMVDGEGTLRLEVADAEGNSLQLIDETASGSYSYPYAEDIDGDGTLDLMVPLLTGNVNTNYAVWLKGADGMFFRAGELSGVSIGRTPEGLIAASGRSSASEWETGYFRVTDGALEEIAAVVNRADPEPGEPVATEPTCEVIRIAEGVDPAPFCADAETNPG
ncbi:MAG: hypothetical protein Q8L84_03855 [Hyphomonas sp.]|nr:hypothetical protein [Hyphomonas sp.]